MKFKFNITLVVCFIATLLLFSSCKKGDTGATGPQGSAGPAGSNGAAGAQGPKGDPGTANVIYSAWLDVTFEADTVHDGTAIDTLGFFASIDAPQIDSAMLAGGEIKVYINLNDASDPFISPLPYTDLFNGITISSDFTSQSIQLYSNIDAGTITIDGTKYQQYRYILVPGSVLAGRTASSIDWKDYKQVKAYLNLKD